ncbi:MAG: FAD-dependent oxidoreductase [Bdellovibrionota bacterium]
MKWKSVGQKRVKKATRREFLAEAGIAAGAVLTTPACSVLDTYFDVDKKYYNDEVVIVGAGAAGLAAAHTLKKKKIPYRLFEASRRVGGRVYTLETPEAKNGIELGVSSFQLKHKIIFDLAKEYKLEIDELELNILQKKVFYYKLKWITQQEIIHLLKPYLQKWSLTKIKLFSDHKGLSDVIVHPLAISFDQWKLRDYFNSLKPKMDSDLVQVLIHWIQTEMAMNENQLSALQWLLFWEKEATNSSLYKIQGGNEKLLRAIYERVSGVIPDHLVQTQSPLTSIKESDGKFECVFNTPKGVRRITTQFLILALPASQLKSVYGLSDLPFAQLKKEAIAKLTLSSQVKMVLGTKEHWGQENSVDGLPIHTQLISRQQLIKYSQMQKQTEVTWSFPEGAKRPKIFQDEVLSELVSIYKKYRSSWNGQVHLLDWSQREWIKGATFHYSDSQFYKYRGIFTEPDFDGRLLFAGDYVHPTEWSSWGGALETGVWAAEKISSIYTKFQRKNRII